MQIAMRDPRFRYVDFLALFRDTRFEPFAAKLIHRECDRLAKLLEARRTKPKLLGAEPNAHVAAYQNQRGKVYSKLPDIAKAAEWAGDDPVRWSQVQFVYWREGLDISKFKTPAEAIAGLSNWVMQAA